MNSEQINALINGLGMMTELYMIIYQNFIGKIVFGVTVIQF